MTTTILVVEDEPSIQELIAASLQQAGDRVLRAETADKLAAEQKNNESMESVDQTPAQRQQQLLTAID